MESFNELKNDKNSQIDNTSLDEKLQTLRSQLAEQIGHELKYDEKRIKEEQKRDSELYLKKIREEVLLEQKQMESNLKEDFRKEISQLKRELEEQRTKVEKEKKKEEKR